MKKGFIALLSAGLLFSSAYQAAAANEPGTKSQKLVLHENSKTLTPQVQVTTSKDKAIPSFIAGKLSKGTYHTEKDVLAFIDSNKQLFQFNATHHLNFISKEKDNLGMTHYVFNQSINGVPVDGAVFMVHTDQQGKITAINGDVHANLPENIESIKKLTKTNAINAAWKHIGEQPKKEKNKPLAFKGAKLSDTVEKSKLIIFKDQNQFKLAYRVALQFIDPYPANWQVYVDANSGKVLKSFNAVNSDGPTTGSGYGVLGDNKTLNTYLSGGTYYLYDTTKAMSGVIETYTARNGSSLPGVYSTDTNNAWTASNQGADVDANYYAGKVYDYYKNTHGRNSFDNAGSTIRSTVHYSSGYNNAFWNGSQMVYGDGDGQVFRPLSGALDVVAHELTHAVTERTAGLNYSYQSGALNESMSDVFGYFLDPNDWLMGEDVYTPGTAGDGLRSLSNPKLYGQPDHMSGYVNTSSDNGGVHTNSGIPNKAAYNTITAIGKAKAEKIYYRALTRYMTPSTNFSSARAALLSATTDLYGSTSTEYNAVKTAWNNVGVN
ncbi:thermolysin [Fictibacillus enclensis]|uniref:Neutral metalloproteinase n=1 Tax=Fictibacillus enclensis TaxID=1017270 RepID=A0A0V8JAV3_9BACL|nr:M4 family metallopeptidase [Fictibacillus enclensis]KSU84327.1 peptidase M4 [Fictibacillus enclensis]SCB77263.1 thermolysin [Fictibacillus enclensis]